MVKGGSLPRANGSSGGGAAPRPASPPSPIYPKYNPPTDSGPTGDYGVFPDMDAAIEAGERAFYALREKSVADRETYISVLREVGLREARRWAEMTVAETGMGRVPHKMIKFDVVCKKTPGTEDLAPWARTGDRGLVLEEPAPYGLIAAVTPSTHPVPTLINNAISMIAGGNTAVFNPHPAGKAVFADAVRTLNRAMMQAGAPPNLIVCIAEPTIESAGVMFNHPKTRIIMVTGGPGVVKAALAVPKKSITAGPGNPPVVVDETADIDNAAHCITEGGGFDNNVLCIGEKEVFCVESVFEQLREAMRRKGNVELTRQQIDQLAEKAFIRKGDSVITNRDLVGRNARVLAETIGMTGVGDDVPLLFGEVEFDHLWVQEEQLMPFMPLVRCKDVWEAIDMAIEAEHGYRHTACMHSRNIENMSVMAKRCDASIFVKNGSSAQGLAAGGEGYTSFSIASPTGEGLTSARTFTRKRRCTLVDSFRIV
ncbi:aldehyde dehydrogenase EutE [bacterium]|nr:aldehyde dehydrogenase EutE [bacterium]